MASLAARPAGNLVDRIAQDPRCVRGLEWIGKNAEWVTAQQIRLTEIPAPEFNETLRGESLKKLFEASGLKARTDKAGNVIGERAGSEGNGVVLIVAHLDTVFPPGTDVTVKRDGDRLEAPGISDNGAGLAAIVGLARAFYESKIRTAKTIVFAGDVGEEGEGNLRGIRALVDAYGPRISEVIAVDGASTDHITTQAVASRRFEVNVTGPGGHSWSDFGSPNPITALARSIVRFSSVRVPDLPRSSYNIGVIEGGTSVNSIPSKASVKIDLRSEEEAELDRLETALREAMQAGVREEVSAARSAGESLKLDIHPLGARPAGKLPDNSLLLETIRDVDSYLGNSSHLERSSTDANIPLSLNIPAVALGGGGRGGGSHTLGEWYVPAGRELGLKRLFLASVVLAGIRP